MHVLHEMKVVGPGRGDARLADLAHLDSAVVRARFQAGLLEQRLARGREGLAGQRESRARQIDTRRAGRLAESDRRAGVGLEVRDPARPEGVGHPADDCLRMVERRVAREGQGHAGQPAAPPKTPPTPSVAGGHLGVERIELGEPVLGRRAHDGEPEDDDHLGAAGRPPDRVAPADGIAGLQDEPPAHRVVADPGEVQGHDGLRPATAARMAQHVDDREGIDQPSGIDGNGPPAAHERPASFELLHRQVHALPPQRPEGAFDTVAPDQALEVSGLAPRVGQQRPVRAGRIAVHEIAAETEEVGLAIRQARAHRSAGLGAGDATPEKAGQAGKKRAATRRSSRRTGRGTWAGILPGRDRPCNRRRPRAVGSTAPSRSGAPPSPEGGRPARPAGSPRPGRSRGPTGSPARGAPGSRGSRRPPGRTC